jgi:hypothetical protein
VTPQERRDSVLYNILPGERARIYAFQNGRDPITGRPLTALANLDHCHRDGLIRGLLNPFTNKYLIDDLDILRASIAYLENPPAVRALGKVYGLIGKAQRKKKMLYGPDGSPAPLSRSRGAAGAVSSTADALT